MIENIQKLPVSVEKLILDFINEKNIPTEYLVRDSIFNILEKYCTVLYYPLENEENDGCHVERLVNNKVESFVFINTNKAVEKQVFTAAHELGHILKLDDYLSMKL